MSEKEDSRICIEPICRFVKGKINYIVTEVPEAERKEEYNTFYTNLLESKGDCTELRILAKTYRTNVHLWGNKKDAMGNSVNGDQYTPEIAKMYNILTSSLAVLCNSSDSCNFEEMKELQLEILDETNKLVIKGLGNIDMELNNTIEMIDPKNDNLKVGASETEEGASETEEGASETEEGAPVLRNLAAIFGASYEFINNTIITPANVEVFAGIINKMIFIMQHPIDTFFGALDCYNRFLISAIGNKLTTILNSITIAGIAVSIGISAGHAVLVDTLNEQNLLQLAATFYYYSQFINPTLSSLFKFKQLGDSIKIHLMTKIPNLAKEKIDIAANTIRYYIDKLAKPTEDMTLEHTEKVVKDITNITNITEIIENAIPNINARNVIIVENGEEIALMTEKDRRLLESYLNENANLKDGGPGEGPGQFKKKKKKKIIHT